MENIESLVEAFGCQVGSLPSSYLGLPLGAPFKSIPVWDDVEERLCRRLALWKRQYISKGGQLTLIRSTLFIYFFFFLICKKAVYILRRAQGAQRVHEKGTKNSLSPIPHPSQKPHQRI